MTEIQSSLCGSLGGEGGGGLSPNMKVVEVPVGNFHGRL